METEGRLKTHPRRGSKMRSGAEDKREERRKERRKKKKRRGEAVVYHELSSFHGVWNSLKCLFNKGDNIPATLHLICNKIH